MMGFFIWVSEHWLQLVQTIGIVSGLGFTGYSLRLNARIKKIDTLVNLTQQHRAIWLKYLDSTSLKQVLSETRDIRKEPLTDEEGVFINLIILHMATTIAAARSGIFPEFAGQDKDLTEFFSLPVPGAVWESTKAFRDPAMVRYVDGLLWAKRLHDSATQARKTKTA